jgi:hypothetical protein
VKLRLLLGEEKRFLAQLSTEVRDSGFLLAVAVVAVVSMCELKHKILSGEWERQVRHHYRLNGNIVSDSQSSYKPLTSIAKVQHSFNGTGYFYIMLKSRPCDSVIMYGNPFK